MDRSDDFRITLAADPEGGWTVIGYVGDYSDPGRFGDFSLTREMVASWQRNLAAGAVTGQPGMLAIDFDHSSQQGSTRAAGWLREIRLDGREDPRQDRVDAGREGGDRGG